MIDVHVPTSGSGIDGILPRQKFITEGLDAVVLETKVSESYPGAVCMTLAGPRDLAVAVERASKIGGVTD